MDCHFLQLPSFLPNAPHPCLSGKFLNNHTVTLPLNLHLQRRKTSMYDDPDLALLFQDKDKDTQILVHDFSTALSIPHIPTPPSPTPTNCQPPFSQYTCCCPLASSRHKLHSNLVSSLGLLTWLKLYPLLVIVRSPQGRPLDFYMSLHYTWVCAARDLITQPV